jgi:methionyl-tRNA formyltransferase
MRVVLASMNEIGKHSLEELVKFVDVVGLFTNRERGNMYMDPTDFTEVAAKHGVPVFATTDINSEEVAEQIRALDPDLGMCLGWKQIVKRNVLGIPRYGWIGAHPTKLLLKGEEIDPKVLSAPGNEPMNYAILGGYEKTGMSLFWLKPKVDTGEIFARAQVDIDTEHETARTLVEKIGRITRQLLRENMPSIIAGNPPRLKQEFQHTQSFMKPLTAEGNRIDPSAPIKDTYRLIRSCSYPYPNAFIDFYGKRIYVEHARLENGVFSELKLRTDDSAYARAGR